MVEHHPHGPRSIPAIDRVHRLSTERRRTCPLSIRSIPKATSVRLPSCGWSRRLVCLRQNFASCLQTCGWASGERLDRCQVGGARRSHESCREHPDNMRNWTPSLVCPEISGRNVKPAAPTGCPLWAPRDTPPLTAVVCSSAHPVRPWAGQGGSRTRVWQGNMAPSHESLLHVTVEIPSLCSWPI
jgi:hypothetical protein